MEEAKKVANENFDWNAFENDLGVYDQPKEQIGEAYDKTLSNIAANEVTEGTVIGINKREVVVNIGYKSEGIIPISEFRYNPDLKVGDKIEVYVESAEDKNGQLALSHKKARQLKSWDHAYIVFSSSCVLDPTKRILLPCSFACSTNLSCNGPSPTMTKIASTDFIASIR